MMLLTNIRTFVRLRQAVIVVLVGWSAAATLISMPTWCARAQTANPSWSYTGNFNRPREGHSATLLPSGEVLVIGGSNSGSAELYDPATRAWTFTGSLNVIGGGCSTVLPNGKVLVVGDGRAELYDPSTGTFTVTGNMTEQASCYTATSLPNGKVLITAFYFSNGPVSATPELYDPSTGTFTSTGRFVDTAADQLFDYTATLLPNGKVLIAVPIAQLYDPVSGTFSLTGPMIAPFERYGRTATLLRNGKVLLAGGADDFGRHRNAELYDPSSGMFTATGDMNIGRAWHTATLLPDGTVLIAGGETEDCGDRGCSFAGTTASTEIYDPSTGTFSSVGNMNARREVHTATLLNNGRVLVAGGLWYGGIGDFRGSLASAELYNIFSNPASIAIDDAQFFVRQQYLDFLNREPDQSGADFWTNVITSCGTEQQCIEVKRINVSAAFFLSIEFQQTGYLVYRMYRAAYGNLPGAPVPIKLNEFLSDTQEIGHGVVVLQPGWETALENNKQAFADEFVNRSRFASAYPSSIAPAEFVDRMNTNAGSPLSQTERDRLVSDLTTGAKTRAQVLRAVAENQNLSDAEFNRAFVLMQYFGYLRRDPNSGPDTDFSGFNFWLSKLNAFNGDYVQAEMVKAFITSGEYRSRFGS
jgi:hypothetical protein